METVTSRDGTIIAFDRAGTGPALIVVDGALGQRAMEAPMGRLVDHPLIQQYFSVIEYDRRGRGDSTDTPPYDVQREIEDIEALIDHVGGSAFLVGFSSGAALAFEAALALGDKVRGLAMYEAPYNDEADSRRRWRDYRRELGELLAANRRGDAVGLFMMLVGATAQDVEWMRQHPMWPMFEVVAPTLLYDAAVMGEEAAVPVRRAAALRVPTLVMAGGATEWPFMRVTAEALARAIPRAELRILEGQTHEVTPDAIAPALLQFFRPEVELVGEKEHEEYR